MAVIKGPRDKPLISVSQSLASENWLKIVYLIPQQWTCLFKKLLTEWARNGVRVSCLSMLL
jgi:hypothetical protein